jgi:hypothetical protein
MLLPFDVSESIHEIQPHGQNTEKIFCSAPAASGGGRGTLSSVLKIKFFNFLLKFCVKILSFQSLF